LTGPKRNEGGKWDEKEKSFGKKKIIRLLGVVTPAVSKKGKTVFEKKTQKKFSGRK